jgi:hypothetical protein
VDQRQASVEVVEQPELNEKAWLGGNDFFSEL